MGVCKCVVSSRHVGTVKKPSSRKSSCEVGGRGERKNILALISIFRDTPDRYLRGMVSNRLWSRQNVLLPLRHISLTVGRRLQCNVPLVVTDIPPRGRVQEPQCVPMWMDAFLTTGNVSKERKGLPKTDRTPENAEQVRVSIHIGM
ncbi:hypothetical protein TNCV_3659381 [Trichonephila clavipes]|nr:hypothetical protein TNCV_3659381 [Trichonephila clavipes]